MVAQAKMGELGWEGWGENIPSLESHWKEGLRWGGVGWHGEEGPVVGAVRRQV